LEITLKKDELGVGLDEEATKFWAEVVEPDRILKFSAKDNFWEMGETGPCGPCSEIHIDLRSDEERKKIDGAVLVNADHEEVIEIWNLVFIQFNRKKDGSLEPLKDMHVDTGMGFERIVRAMQNEKSNYDTDIFTPLLKKIEEISGLPYTKTQSKKDIAFRVIADHIRAIVFTITDGQLPSNTGAGYVIRRILRRAVRYAYSFLNINKTFLADLVKVLTEQLGEFYPALEKNLDLTIKVITEEETSFLKTLESGLKRFAAIEANLGDNKFIPGEQAFELYDTYGFPIDLTRLMASEKGYEVDEPGFEKALNAQKERARSAAKVDASDWVILNDSTNVEFVGYDQLEAEAKILRYRKVEAKKKTAYQIVLNKTPFYAESGGQVGDKGLLIAGEEKIAIYDTQKENDLILHFAESLPEDPSVSFMASVNASRRNDILKNHSATHLLHAALRNTLGTHVEQKGSLVAPNYFRFDFSHFSKMEEEELLKVEQIINEKIRDNIALNIETNVPIETAKEKGAMALFGEKYGDNVRVVTIDPDYSVELCGGTHVEATGEIGLCKLTVETSVAAGVRRIEAITGKYAMDLVQEQSATLSAIKEQLKLSGDLVSGVEKLMQDNNSLRKDFERLQMQQASSYKDQLKQNLQQINGTSFAAVKVDTDSAEVVKKIAFDLRKEVENVFLVLGAEMNGKAHLSIMIDEELGKANDWNASQLIREWAKHIQGGGGGQPFFATAGGKNPDGLNAVFDAAKSFVESKS